MPNNAEPQRMPVQWKWVVIGVVVGLVIMTLSYIIIAPVFHSFEIQALVMMIGFVLTGVIVGYFSPGITIREAMIAGFLLMIAMAVVIISLRWEEGSHTLAVLLLLLFGGFLAQVGGWVGEKLQGTLETPEASATTSPAFQTKWVLVGTALGLILNIIFVFFLAPVLNIDLNRILFAFSFSFVVTGFIVGVKSPGVTLKEPAVAGVIAVLLEWLFVQFALHLPVSFEAIAFGLVEGFLLTLLGAWIGEKYQASGASSTESA